MAQMGRGTAHCGGHQTQSNGKTVFGAALQKKVGVFHASYLKMDPKTPSWRRTVEESDVLAQDGAEEQVLGLVLDPDAHDAEADVARDAEHGLHRRRPVYDLDPYHYVGPRCDGHGDEVGNSRNLNSDAVESNRDEAPRGWDASQTCTRLKTM